MAMAGRYRVNKNSQSLFGIRVNVVAGIGWRVWRSGVWRSGVWRSGVWRWSGLLGGMCFLVGLEQLAETDLGIYLRSIWAGRSSCGLKGQPYASLGHSAVPP